MSSEPPPPPPAPHVPVFPAEVEALLGPVLVPGAVVLDGTLGAGGHAALLLPRILPGGVWIGIDRDPAALAIAGQRLAPFGEAARLVAGRFGDLADHARREAPGGLDAILLDVGVSSMQLDEADRGFSFGRPGPLDMRMDPSDDDADTAADLIRTLPEEDLANLIYGYGEERLSRRIARAICETRRREAITRTDQLADIIRGAVPRGYERGRIDPATRTFQALRIAVNRETEELERALAAIPDALRPGGRAAVIAFHSLEDRLVKRAFRDADREGRLRVLTKKPLRPSDEEARTNRRARSAKLRAVEREEPAQPGGDEGGWRRKRRR